ncbi:MAG: AhpC/TSA family protein [Fimbriimonadaceae bacterium]|nr:AhpC/TSA family protein [Fimbriimonadaceae bacterium]
MNVAALLLLSGTVLAPQDSTVGIVASKAEDVRPVGVGSLVPDVPVTTVDGETKPLRNITNGNKTVIVFYRGGWCPFCNTHLQEVGQIKDELKAMGYQIVAISPDKPEELKKSMDKNEIDYTLLSDSSAGATKAFGLAFRVDDDTFTMYRDRFQIDLERSSGMDHHILPVPAVYLVNERSQITFLHFNPNYRERLKSDAILEAAKS